ncbi:hypothetical protein GCM10007147_45890 [Nocardiopsis kunsanensis]|uniref:Uncharacterized protein n=1 Tax=Nocardiopsis kunsanensis TaxID=141693 RepID=A0A918XM93_9ACTN|nr:hypothetical protein GCM10007147_45890 [Nocardiopsis kunsanensis]
MSLVPETVVRVEVMSLAASLSLNATFMGGLFVQCGMPNSRASEKSVETQDKCVQFRGYPAMESGGDRW